MRQQRRLAISIVLMTTIELYQRHELDDGQLAALMNLLTDLLYDKPLYSTLAHVVAIWAQEPVD